MATANTTSTNTNATSPTLRYAYNTHRSTGGGHGRRLHQTGPIALPSTSQLHASTLPLTPPPDTPSFDDKFASLNSLTLGDRDFPNQQLLREREDAMRRPPMRTRGESDLGRPQTRVQIPKFQPGSMPIPEVVEQRSKQLPSLIEIATGVLIPLPFLFASLGFPIKREAVTHNALLIEDLKDFSSHPDHITSHPKHVFDPNFPFIETCFIAGMTLLIVGGVGFATSGAALTPPPSATTEEDSRFSVYTIRRVATKALGAALPFYAALQLGGGRAALVMLLAITIGTPSLLGQALGTTGLSVASVLKNRQYTLGWLALLVLSDVFGLSTSANHPHELILGYIALTISAFILPPPLSLKGWQARHSSPSSKSTSAVPTTPWSETPPATPQLGGGQSDDVQQRAYRDHREDNRPSMMAGAFLMLLSFILAVMKGQSLQSVLKPAGHEVLFRFLALASSAALVLFARPASLHTHAKFGVLAGCATVALTGAFYASQSYQIPILYAMWSGLAYIALLFDSNRRTGARTAHHAHSHASGEHSKFTGYLLSMTEPGSMSHSILSDKSSRRIAYFASLNLAFMTVQFSYGLATGSLGLLTDSIHMLFDCAGLAVGLAASIMSKWPPSVNFPYGYGKVETLSGFANGILLILVCVEIVFDAIHRLTEGAELTRLNELLVVSTLGCIVNLLGLVAFGHAHHGNDHHHDHAHGHTHDHDHSHIDEKSHHHDHHHNMNGHANHTHTHSHNLSNGLIDASPILPPKTPSSTSHSNSHAHSHENDNMRGIFLHVLADTLGSVAVIVSTLLIKWNGWAGWDPIASVIVSIMIFVSALPLVTNSARKLLLSLPDEEAYRLREVLLGMGELKGVAGYAGVRFWTGEGNASSSPAEHADHDHQHGLGVVTEKDLSDLKTKAAIHGTIHVMAARTADFDDVRQRTEEYLGRHGIDAVVQVEREGGGRCWCGGGLKVGG